MYSQLVGNELRSLRGRYNMTLEDLSNKAQISKQKLSDYENNKVKMSVYVLEKIVNSYNIELPIFFKSIYEYTHINSDN